jgi:hypothetical protein
METKTLEPSSPPAFTPPRPNEPNQIVPRDTDAALGRQDRWNTSSHYYDEASEAGGASIARNVAKGLGAFSIALGAAELLFANQVNRSLGVKTPMTTRAFGVREIATGVGILASRNPAPWVWARVAGDLADLAALGAAQWKGRLKRTDERMIAAAAVLGVTMLDIWCASALTDEGGPDA